MAEYSTSLPAGDEPAPSTAVVSEMVNGQISVTPGPTPAPAATPAPTPPAAEPAAQPAPAATPALAVPAKPAATPATPAAPDPATAPAADPAADPAAAAAAVVASKGMDINAFRDEFVANGELSAESFAALEAQGLPKALVEEFIAGQQARQELLEYNDKKIVGGPEQYAEMINWAAKALNEAEIAAFNTAIFTSDGEQRKLAIQGLHARFEATLGQEPRLLTGDQTGQTPGGFRSQAEITRAMSDPRYESDEAYRNDVIAKLALDL